MTTNSPFCQTQHQLVPFLFIAIIIGIFAFLGELVIYYVIAHTVYKTLSDTGVSVGFSSVGTCLAVFASYSFRNSIKNNNKN